MAFLFAFLQLQLKNMTVMYISELNKKKKKIEQNSYIIREQHV